MGGDAARSIRPLNFPGEAPLASALAALPPLPAALQPPAPLPPRRRSAPPTAQPPPPGSRVAVRFKDGIEYAGTVEKVEDANHAFVRYDDGQSETVRFPDPDVRVTGFGPEAPATKPAAKPRAKPPRAARTAPAAAPAAPDGRARQPAAKKPQSKPAPRRPRAGADVGRALAQPAAKKPRTAPPPEPAPAPRARPPRAARRMRARVGRWVEVWWPEQSKWYLGHVGEARYSDAAAGVVFRVEYTDGETEDEVLQEDAFAGAGAPPPQPEGAPKAWRFATEPTSSTRWTLREEEDLIRLVEELGEDQWDAVAERLGTGRTWHGVKGHWEVSRARRARARMTSRTTGRKPHAPRLLAAPAAKPAARRRPAPVAAAPAATTPPPGTRVAVRFSDGEDYAGTVGDALDETSATVQFDDGTSDVIRFPDPDVRITSEASAPPRGPGRLTRRGASEEEAQLSEAIQRSLADAAPPSPPAPPTPPSPAPRQRPAAGALLDAPARPRFKYVYPPRRRATRGRRAWVSTARRPPPGATRRRRTPRGRSTRSCYTMAGQP